MGKYPVFRKVTRTEIFFLKSAATTLYVLPVLPAIALPLRNHWRETLAGTGVGLRFAKLKVFPTLPAPEIFG